MILIFYCPHCGKVVKEQEEYCVSCGNKLPHDMNHRQREKRPFNKLWYLPIFICLFFVLILTMSHFVLQYRFAEAKDYYDKGEIKILDENYTEAEKLFNKSLKYKRNFSQATIALNYIENAKAVESVIDDALTELDDENYQQAISLIDEAEKTVKNYTGTAVTQLVNNISEHRNHIKLEQLKQLLKDQPNIDDLKNLLWEAEAIQNDEAEEITNFIQTEISGYTFEKASEQLKSKNFQTAKTIAEDGLRYIPESEKLQSLEAIINKEKDAYETSMERQEQSVKSSKGKYKVTDSDAVKMHDVQLENDYQNRIVVKGAVESMASIPLHALKVNYSLLKDGSELKTNGVYVYPEMLNPDEIGKFTFTHFNLNEKADELDVKINSITWYPE